MSGRAQDPPRVWTVGQVNRAVRRLLADQASRLWVAGEVTGFRRYGSGHCYFTLRDREAQISCVMFRDDAQRLPADPEDGMALRVFGKPALYAEQGRFQLVAQRLEAEGGDGMWKLAFERLRARIEREGLADPARKRPLPPFPGTVGVATSTAGAALRDIVAVTRRRAPWVRLLVRGTPVQGLGSGERIAAAIAALGRAGADVVIAARGGGSIEDLWGFNEEPVARAVAACPVPVISGVGHATDFTICDMVADHRAATPSAAAEAAVPDGKALGRRLNLLRDQIERAAAGQARDRRRRLAGAGRELVVGARARLVGTRARMDQLGDRMGRAVSERVRGRRRRLEGADRELVRGARARLGGARGRLDAGRREVSRAMRDRVGREGARLASAAAAIEALSPLSTLARGYAVPIDEGGRLLRETADFAPAASFDLRVVDGSVPCEVADRNGAEPEGARHGR